MLEPIAPIVAQREPRLRPAWGAALALSGCFSTATIPTAQLGALDGLGDPTSAEGGQRRVVHDTEGESWDVRPGDALVLCAPVLAAPAQAAWAFDPRRTLGAPEDAYSRHVPCGVEARLDAVQVQDGHLIGRRVGYRVVDVPIAAIDHAEIDSFDAGQTLLTVGIVVGATAGLVLLSIATGGFDLDMGGAQWGP